MNIALLFAIISRLKCHSQVVFCVSLGSLSHFSTLFLSSLSSFAGSMSRPLSISGSRSRIFSRGRSRSRSLSRSLLRSLSRSLSRSLRSSRYRSRGFSSRAFLVSRSDSRFFSLLFESLLLSFSTRNENESPKHNKTEQKGRIFEEC